MRKSLQASTINREGMQIHNRPVAGWFCSYVPEELLAAAGILPYRIRGIQKAPGKAGSFLPNFFCPLVIHCLNNLLHTTLDPTGAYILTNSCNAMEKLYDIIKHQKKNAFVYMLDIPRKQTKEGVRYFKQCIRQLKEALEQRYHLSITEDALRNQITLYNKTRDILSEMSRMVNKALLSEYDLLVLIAKADFLPREQYNSLLQEHLDHLTGLEREKASLDARPARNWSKVIVTGGALNHPELIKIIEQTGARVVMDDVCTGSRYYQGKIDETGDPLAAIARRYLFRIPCPRMVNSPETRCHHLLEEIGKKDVDGVIYYGLKFCPTHLFEYEALKNVLKKEGIPLLYIESDYTLGSLEQVKTRIQAFIEIL
jgi:benzoyl-CoA reductase/2-hydroxyglutaryl-CoA dehydratase subunit BcrC/BadD/HgdB